MEKIIERYGNVVIYAIEGENLPIYQTILKEGEFGKLQSLIEDENLEEIMYIGEKKTIKVYHRRHGMCNTNILMNEEEIREILKKLAKRAGKEFNEENAILDIDLIGYGRINATMPPISPEGITLTIRKFPFEQFTILDLIKKKTISLEAAAYLWIFTEGLGKSPCNILISGSVDSGKTTTLNLLTHFIPERERIITIEDVSELKLLHENWIKLEASLTQFDLAKLLRSALRMRPDRIIIGEVRGEEAEILFTAMNTGQRGCIATIHANSAMETITRLISKPMNVPPIMLKALDLIILQDKFLSNEVYERKIMEICEIGEFETDKPTLNTLFKFNGNELVNTNVPSILREKISNSTGITLKEFDKILEMRRDFLKKFLMLERVRAIDLFNAIQNYYKSEAIRR
jgi:flagellar protein FlaI